MKKSWTPITLEEADRRIEATDEPADRLVELAEHAHHLLRLRGVGEPRPPAEVGEDHRDLSPVASEDRLVTGRDDRVGELRREESPEPPEPLELGHLLLDAPLERAVQLRNGVVVALDPEQRPDAGEELVVIERLRDEVVRAGLDRHDLFRAVARRDHDHREDRGLLALTE